MISLKLQGMEAIAAKLEDLPKRLDKAQRLAISRTGNHIREAEKTEIERVFDRPTRWTLGAMRVKESSGEVVVGIIDPDGYYRRAQNYLSTQVTGGARRHKAFERSMQQRGIMPQGWYAVPGEGAKIDAYGNMGPGQIRQILSWFDAAENWAGSTQNMGQAGRDKRRKGTRKKYGFEYFAVTPGSRRSFIRASGNLGSNKMQPGIYMRVFTGFGGAIKPIVIFVQRASYSKRFDFERVARDTWDANITKEFEAAVDHELARAGR